MNELQLKNKGILQVEPRNRPLLERRSWNFNGNAVLTAIATMVQGIVQPPFNSLLPNNAIWRHDLCELSISLWEFIWGFNTRRYTLVQGFCFFWLFLMGCKELTHSTLRYF